VVLYHLGKMRASEEYVRLAGNEDGVVVALAEEYQFRSHLGDQCMFSLLGKKIGPF